MAFPAKGIQSTYQPLGSAQDMIPITASAANNVFGVAYNTTNGGDARACEALYASVDMTVSFVTAKGVLRSDVPLIAGYHPIKVIQVTAISTGTLYALI